MLSLVACACASAHASAETEQEGETLLLGLSTTEVIAIAAVAALILTLGQIYMALGTERRRTQPIVITHERTPRTYSTERQCWVTTTRVANEAEGTAFNTTFGVSYFGARFAYRLAKNDPLSGNRHRVLKPDESFLAVIEITSGDLWGGHAKPEESVYYWARYQNASGTTWETRNPPNRSEDLDISRVRFVRFQEWREKKARIRLTKEGEAVMREVAAELSGDDEGAGKA